MKRHTATNCSAQVDAPARRHTNDSDAHIITHEYGVKLNIEECF